MIGNRSERKFVLWLVVAVLATGGMAAGGQAAARPEGVIDQFEAALNAGNVEACVAWMAGDGVIDEGLGKEVKGDGAIRDYLRSLAAHRYRASSIGERKVEGTGVSWKCKVSFDGLTALGVDSVEGRARAVVVKGKIQRYHPAFSPGSMFMLSTAASRATEDLVRSVIEEVYNKGDTGAVDRHYAEDFKNHDPLPGTKWDREGIKDEVGRLRKAFEGFSVTVEQVVATGEFVSVRTVRTGRHEGEYQGHPPTYRDIKIGGIEILRVAEGRIVERWAQQNDYELGLITGLIEEVDEKGKKKSGGGRKKYKTKGKSGGVLGWFFDLF